MDGIASSVPLIARPSYDRACSLVPTEYVLAWGGSCARSSVARFGKNFLITLKLIAPSILIA